MPVDENIQLAQVSPLLVENCFHLLSDTDGEEANRIVATLPPPVVNAPPTLAKRPLVLQFRIVLKKIGRETCGQRPQYFMTWEQHTPKGSDLGSIGIEQQRGELLLSTILWGAAPQPTLV